MRSTTLLLALVLLLGSAPAWGTTVAVVFATDDDSPVDPGVPVELQKGSTSESVYLYVVFGSGISSTPCVDGATGDETCGFDVSLKVEGDPYIVAFYPETHTEPGVDVAYMPQSFTTSSRQLRAVGVTAIGPAAGPQRIGELVLDTTGANGGTVEITGGKAVRADLQSFPVQPRQVATTELPEPGEMLLLASGILGLAALYRLRARSAKSA